VRPDVTLTCPATWGAARRTMLAEAAARAGLEGARLVAEPVAAATYFAEVLGRDVPIGSVVVVHDFGAGTFDASVVARTSSGFEVMAVDGRDDVGGLDVDAAVVEHLRTPEWQRLMEPSTVEERRAQRQLWDDVRIAKERLSRAQSADFVVPLLDAEVHLTRDELEKLARPVLDQTVRITKKLIRWADLPDGRLAGVFLVGGASRIPLVATLLHRELGEAPVVIEQPELVVAEGSILADAAMLTTGPAAPGPTAEMRLVSTARPETETVHVAVVPARAAGLTGLQPPVDPWPDADPAHWLPDPEATVPRTKAELLPDPEATVPRSKPGRRPDPEATVPRSKPGRRPDPEATVPSSKAQFGAAPRPPAAAPRPMSPAPRPVSVPPRPVSVPPRPVSVPPASRTVTGSARPVQPAAKVRPVRKPKPRRRGGFGRFVRFMLSLLVMTVVPLAALVLAYGYGNGDPIDVDARNVLRDILDLLGI